MPGLRIKQGGLIPFTTIKKDGQPPRQEEESGSVLADSEKTITGVIGEAEFPDDLVPTLLMYGL